MEVIPMKTLALILVLFGVTVAGGCVVAAGPHGEVAVIEAGHVHSEACGHYYYGGRWYYHAHHHHGPGCGHVYRGGVWVWVG
jgi:hypothetical protein